MIISFKDEETANIYNGINSKKAQIKLDMINRAYRLEDLKVPPNNKLEKLTKNLSGKYSIRINDQYRIIFRWEQGEH